MPQRPYPGSVEKARLVSKTAAHRARASVVRTQRRERFRHDYVGPNVVYVMDGGNAWSAYLRRMLDATGLSVAELARRAQIDRSTVSVWVNRGNASKKITIDSVLRIAAALDADPGEALDAAAGLTRMAPERDSEVEMILASDWSEERKAEMIDRLMRRREEQRRELLADLRFLLGESAGPDEAAG